MVDEEIAFDPDIHKSHLGRLVKVRESTNHTWQHGVPCFAVTEWELEDYHGDGKMCKVEKPTGGYQLQWGLFERIEQAMSQKRSAKTFSSEAEPFYLDELVSRNLAVFTDVAGEPGTLDLDKCGVEAAIYRTKKAVSDRRVRDRERIEAAKLKQDLDRLAKAKAAADTRRLLEEKNNGAKRGKGKSAPAAAAVTTPGRARQAQSAPRLKPLSTKSASKSAPPPKPPAETQNPATLKRARKSTDANGGEGEIEILLAAAALIGVEVGVVGLGASSPQKKESLLGGSRKRARSGGALPVVPSSSAKKQPTTACKNPNAARPAGEKTREQIAAEVQREKAVKARAAADVAAAEAASAKRRADAAFEAAMRLGNSPVVGLGLGANGVGSPRPHVPEHGPPRRTATKTSLKQRLFGGGAEVEGDANPSPGWGANASPGWGANLSPGWGANLSPGWGTNLSPGWGANLQPNTKTSTPSQTPSSDDDSGRDDDTDGHRANFVNDGSESDDADDETLVHAAPTKPSRPETQNPATKPPHGATVKTPKKTTAQTSLIRPVNTLDTTDPAAHATIGGELLDSAVFAGATPTSWILRLLVSRMSNDPTIRAVFLNSLCAMEEKHFDFAHRILTEHDFTCGWRFRLLEYLDRARGLDHGAATNAELAKMCERREHDARETRKTNEARAEERYKEQRDAWTKTHGDGNGNGSGTPGGKNTTTTDKTKNTPTKPASDATTAVPAAKPLRPYTDESDPFLDERPGAQLKLLPALGARTVDADVTNGDAVSAGRSDRHAASGLDGTDLTFVKASPTRAASASGVVPSGPLPIRGAVGYSTNAVGLGFKIAMENAGASEIGDWRGMTRLAKRDAAARPMEALTLTLSGLMQWRVGDLEGAKPPLRSAMHHDGNNARAAPLLFEVLLTSNETDEAEVVWDTALHRGEFGPTYERLIATALRCGEGAEGIERDEERNEEATS